MTHIVRVDPDDPVLVEQLTDVLHRSMKEDWAELAQLRLASDLQDLMRNSEAPSEFYLIHIGPGDLTDPIGMFEVTTFNGIDPEVAFILIRVLRDVQGYGFGREALEFAKNRVKELGRSKLETMSSARSRRDDRNARFLINSGWTDARRLLRQDLLLGDDRVADWQEKAVPPEGLQLEVSLDELTLAHVREMLDLSQIWVLDPWTEEELPIGVEDVHRLAVRNFESGMHHLDVVARDASGTAVGFTAFRWIDRDSLIEHQSTFVTPEHRSRRLSSAMKARALLTLREVAPTMNRARTFLPDEDFTTASVNRLLGYDDTAFYRYWEQQL